MFVYRLKQHCFKLKYYCVCRVFSINKGLCVLCKKCINTHNVAPFLLTLLPRSIRIRAQEREGLCHPYTHT